MVDSALSILDRTITSLEYDDSLFEKFTFQSVITKLEKPIGKGCPVHVMNKLTGQVVYKTETDESSTVYIPNLRKYNKYIIIAVDIQDVYNSVVFDLNWDLTSDFGYNYSLNYYDISDLDNVQAIFDFQRPTMVTDSNLVASLTTPFISDGSQISWSSTGNLRRENIGTIPAYYLNGSSNIYTTRSVFYRNLPFTFECYFSISDLQTGSLNQCLFTQQQTALNKYVALYVDPTLNLIFERQEVVAGIPTIKMLGLQPLQIGKNYHVALCYDGTAFSLFLNGVLQTTLEDSVGYPYYDSIYYIGYQFIGNIGGVSITETCKYTTNFDVLFQPISYNKIIYNDPTDTFAQYVALLIKNNKLTSQVMLDDRARNTRFQTNLNESNKDFFIIQNTFTPTIAPYTSLPLGTQDFCLEMCFKLLSKVTYPTLISNQSTATEWTSNNWALTASHASQLNKYSFWVYNSTTYNLLYPSIFKEQIDIAIVRQGTKLRFYVNGYLDSEVTIAANLNIDSKPSTFLSLGRDINFNLYDLKLTIGNCRYTTDYTPKLIDIANKDILELQYQYVNLPFKKNLVDGNSPLILGYKGVILSSAQSINGTNSAYFDGTSSYLLDNWYTSKEKFCAEMFVYPTDISMTQTLFSLYDATSEKFKVGIVGGKLSFNNGTSWADTTYTLDTTKFNHIVIKRDKAVLKILANGSLVYTATISATLGNPLKVSIGSSKYTTEYFKGYINNLYIYKNYIKYADTYTVPVEDIVVDPNIEPVVIVTPNTTAALDFENGLTDKVPTTTWTAGGNGSTIASNKLYGSNSFQTNVIGDCITLPYNHLNSANPYTIDFYMLYKDGTRGSSRTDNNISLFSKNTSSDRYLSLNDNRLINWTLPFINKGCKVRPNEITHYTITYDGAASRIFINDVLETVAGGTMDFVSGSDPLRFGYHYVSGYDNWAFGTKGLWDNFNIHQGIATIVRDVDLNENKLLVDLSFDGENNSTKIIDNGILSSQWIVVGNAKLSTAQSFNGFSSLVLDNSSSYIKSTITTTLTKNFTISFNYKTSDLTTASAVFDARSAVGQYDGFLITHPTSDPTSLQIYLNGNGTSWDVTLNSGSFISANIDYKIDIVCENNLLKFYVNGLLKASQQFSSDLNITLTNRTVSLGRNTNGTGGNKPGYYKNFKIYKDIAILPESPIGKVQLDFKNNILDSYGNSTWTNNGVTFDIPNSYRGTAAYFDADADTLTTVSQDLNFGSGNFYINADLKILPNTSSSMFRYWLTNNIDPNNSGSVWFAGREAGLGIDYNPRPPNYNSMAISDVLPNTYYNHKVILKNTVLHNIVNDVVCNTGIMTNTTFDMSNCTIGGSAPFQNSVRASFRGYLDNFKSIKNYQEPFIMYRPSVHIPFETTPNSIGVVPIASTAYGTPIYQTLNNKKCMKFETGKYVTLSANNIFNLGSTSDFYLEFDFYYTDKTVYGVMFSNQSSTTANLTALTLGNDALSINGVSLPNSVYLYANNSAAVVTSNPAILNSWNNLKLFRKDGTITLALNNVYTTSSTSTPIDFSYGGSAFGKPAYTANSDFKGYISNFKMFVGSADYVDNYSDKEVINVDFKPTKQSYLFRDNFRKCLVQPNNIQARDYLKSTYCCTFNGIDQYISLGKNELLNFGNDDFIINIKFNITDFTNTWQRLLSDNQYNGGAMNYIMVTGSDYSIVENRNKLFFGLSDSGAQYMFSTRTLSLNTDYIATFVRQGNVISMYIDGGLETTLNTTYACNFNLNYNTFLGAANQSESPVASRAKQYFKGTIYSFKVFRNTSDISLLN